MPPVPNSIMSDVCFLRVFAEAVMWDEATIAAGLWRGEMPVRAVEAADRVKEFLALINDSFVEELKCPTSE